MSNLLRRFSWLGPNSPLKMSWFACGLSPFPYRSPETLICRHSTRPSPLGFPHHCSASWRSVNFWKPELLSCPQHHLHLMVKILSRIFSRYEKPNLEFLPINNLWPRHQRVFFSFLVYIELAFLTEDHSKDKTLQNTILTLKRFKLCHEELSKLGPRMIYFAYWVIPFFAPNKLSGGFVHRCMN